MKKNEQITGEETQSQSDTSWWSIGTFFVSVIALLIFVASLPLPSDEEMQERYEQKISHENKGYSQSGDNIYIFDGIVTTTIPELIQVKKELDETKKRYDELQERNTKDLNELWECKNIK
jgi:hypothetical protein